MKILIFSGTLIFQIYFLKKGVWSFIKYKYKDLTVNFPDVVSFHTKVSGCIDKLISMSLLTKCNHLVPLYPVRACLKPMFSGTWGKTSATEAYL
jgi:hypothetical protein